MLRELSQFRFDFLISILYKRVSFRADYCASCYWNYLVEIGNIVTSWSIVPRVFWCGEKLSFFTCWSTASSETRIGQFESRNEVKLLSHWRFWVFPLQAREMFEVMDRCFISSDYSFQARRKNRIVAWSSSVVQTDFLIARERTVTCDQRDWDQLTLCKHRKP